MDYPERQAQLEQVTTDALERLADQLSAGHSDAFKQLMVWHASFHKYSLRNTLLIREQLPTATRVASYKSWKDRGYQVAQGQQAIWIFAPLLKKEKVDGEERQVLTGYRIVPIFDASQLTEESQDRLPSLYQALPDDATEIYEAMVAELKSRNFRVFEMRLPFGTQGSCDPTGRIKIDERLDSRTKILVLSHELCHFAAHFGVQAQGMTVPQMEFQSEATAVVIGAMLGFDSPSSPDYILSWNGTAEQLRTELQTIHGLVKKVMDLLKLEAILQPQAIDTASAA